MAKGQVTTDDLSTGVKSFGGLSSLGGSSRPLRDNPFRDTRAEIVQPAPPAATPDAAPEAPRLEVIGVHEGAVAVDKSTGLPTPEVSPEPRPARQREPVRAAPAARPPDPAAQPAGREKKTELYPEQVSVLLNAEIRDRAEALAKELQRRRTQKTERITTNTVIRVALRAMLEAFRLPESTAINTEGELFEAVLKQWSRK